MAARKLQNEVERCFKKVAEGVAAFEGIYDKIQTCSNPSQKEKLEDALKKEIKKLQRSRDQIKAWAATNDIKDKKPLLEQRKLIETQMEKFKAVEKEMKTKAYSKEGLQAAAKMDPRVKEKIETCQFLQDMMEDLGLQIEKIEAEVDGLTINQKKSKKDSAKASRVAELERIKERHTWHVGKLQTVLRSLENEVIDSEQVRELEDSIRYYVENNQEVNFMEDDGIYDELDLEEREEELGLNHEIERLSSQDAQSVADEPDGENRQGSISLGKPKSTSISDAVPASTRRASTQHLKSPLPTMATLHTPLPNVANGIQSGNMKPAPPPTRAAGEPLKYASAAAAAAATSDKAGVGIAPLPPPPGAAAAAIGLAPLPSISTNRPSVTTSPAASHTQLSPSTQRAVAATEKSPAQSQASIAGPSTEAPSIPSTSKAEEALQIRRPSSGAQKAQEAAAKKAAEEKSPEAEVPPSTPALTNGDTHSEVEEEESVYHLPAGLEDLLESLESTRKDVLSGSKATDESFLAASHARLPESEDAEKPRHYRPQNPYAFTPDHYPQEPLPIFDDPRLYQRIDADTLFYAFYYRQGTWQQYLAAKTLKSQSWRFHKQYQTWFQRHEEPKSITEDYEQGTYRFFDYESTWMNRRKADFKFHYRYLEDDL